MNQWDTATIAAWAIIYCYLVAEILAWWAQFY